jgi:heme exporter protein C
MAGQFNWFKYASAASFYPLAGRLALGFWVAAGIFAVAGLYLTFFVAPPADYMQGQSYKVLFIHVPAAWMSMFIYVVMAAWSAAAMIWRTNLSHMMAMALAPTGALMAFLALWTGALWGKPTWGTWWVWDARLTSELILFFLYVGFMALASAIEDPQRAARACGLLALVGVINIPIIYFSVNWWNTLHQPQSLKANEATMGGSMLAALLIMTLSFWFYCIAAALTRLRSEILEQESGSEWVAKMLSEGKQ